MDDSKPRLVMDASTREGFALLSAQLADVARDVRAGNVAQKEALDEVRRDVQRIAQRTDKLEEHVYRGGGGEGGASDPAIARQVSEHDSEIAALSAQIIVLNAKQDEQTKLLRELARVTRHPLVRRTAAAVGLAIVTWLSVWSASHSSALPSAPPLGYRP